MQSGGTEVKSPIRTGYYFQAERNGDIIDLRVCADGFLYNMVRTMAGTVLYAAEGKFHPDSIPELLASGDRTAAGPVLPPGGLYLTRLWYDGEVGLDA
jgi:tRNA pseudouridine38-40 synthase